MSAKSDVQPTDSKAAPPTGTPLTRFGSVSRRSLLALGPAMAVAAAACSSNNKPTPQTNATDKVKYRTGFGTFGREADVAVAIEKGYFREAGLDVTVLVGTGLPTDTADLVHGKYDFMASETSQYIIQKTQGISKGAHVISAVHQRTVIALMSLAEETSITKPQDLGGKTVGYGAPAPKSLFPTYANLAGFQTGDMAKNWKLFQAPQLPLQLATGKVQVIGQFVTGLPAVRAAALANKKSGEIKVWAYGDYLSDLYGNINVTTDKNLQEKPDMVKRFNQALLKGLQYAVENPDEAGHLANKTWPQTPAAVATAELTVMKPYVLTNGVPVGAIDETRVSKAIALLTSIGMINQGAVTPADFADYTVAPKAS